MRGASGAPEHGRVSAATGKREATAARPWRLLLLRAIAGLSVLFAVIHVVPYGRSHTCPATTREPAWDAPATRRLFMSACGDCHSNTTRWPWYSNIAPVS